MAHGPLWLFNMDMCCSTQISSLLQELQDCKAMGIAANYVARPTYPAAPNEDYLFDCMNLCARMEADGTVTVEGLVDYWHPQSGHSRKVATIRTFHNLDECLEWMSMETLACRDCVEALDENC